jgi:hypothetical protein
MRFSTLIIKDKAIYSEVVSMSRRRFLKWLFTLVTVAAASFLGFWRRTGKDFEASEVPVSAQPNPTPTASEPSPTPEATALTPSTELLLSFMILSDTHVNGVFNEQSDKMRKALNDISTFEPKLDAMFITGDLTDSATVSDYREFNKVMAEYKKLPPVHANMGNHDYYNIWIDKDGQWSKDTAPNGTSDGESRQSFKNLFKYDQVYHDIRVNGVHIIMLSQETYVQERPEVGEGAWYSDEQMKWFKKVLEPHIDGSPVFIMIHQPLPAIGQDGGSGSLIRAKEFRSILQPYSNVFVFSGHRHENLRSGQHYTHETFHWFRNASVGRTRGSGPNNGLTSQGIHVQLYADRVELRGREFMDRTWIPEAAWSIPLLHMERS